MIHPARYVSRRTTGTVGGMQPLLIARRLVLVTACLIALLALGAAPGFAATLEPVGQFASPVYATAPPGDAQRLFVVERAGRIRVMRDGAALDQPFLDISGRVSTVGERGLLSMAFAPDYAASGRFYVFYTDLGGDVNVDEFRRASADAADPASRRNLLLQEHSQATNHNGGQLQVGAGGALYASIGDGANALNAQNRGTLLGKIVRIDPATGQTTLGAYGLRNPWRFSFDRLTGDLTVADVGEQTVEEVDWVPAAGATAGDINFGWGCYEGRLPGPACPAPPSDHTPPVLQQLQSQGFCSITGGYVSRDPQVPSLFGRYVYGDLCDPAVRSAVLAAPDAREDRPTGFSVPSLVSFGEDACGRLYAISIAGQVGRIVEGPSVCTAALAGQPPAAAALPSTSAPAGARVRPTRRSAVALRLRVRGRQRLSRGIVVSVRCGSRCRFRVVGRVRGARGRVTVLDSAAATAPARTTVRLRLTVPSRLHRSLRASGRRAVVVRLHVTASGEGRAPRSASAGIRVALR